MLFYKELAITRKLGWGQKSTQWPKFEIKKIVVQPYQDKKSFCQPKMFRSSVTCEVLNMNDDTDYKQNHNTWIMQNEHNDRLQMLPHKNGPTRPQLIRIQNFRPKSICQILFSCFPGEETEIPIQSNLKAIKAWGQVIAQTWGSSRGPLYQIHQR